MSVCRFCKEPLPDGATARRQFCSDRCRVSAFRVRVASKNLTARAEDPNRRVVLRVDQVKVLDDLALDLEDDLVERMVDAEVADVDLVDTGLATGRAVWRYEDPTLEGLRTLQSDPWFDY